MFSKKEIIPRHYLSIVVVQYEERPLQKSKIKAEIVYQFSKQSVPPKKEPEMRLTNVYIC